MDVRNSKFTPYCHISFPYISKFVINANHQISQPTPLHCTMCQHVEYHPLTLLMPLVESWCMHLPHCLRRPSGMDHTSVGDKRKYSNCPRISFVLFHNVTCYTNSAILGWFFHMAGNWYHNALQKNQNSFSSFEITINSQKQDSLPSPNPNSQHMLTYFQ